MLTIVVLGGFSLVLLVTACILADVIGLTSYRNDLVVDEIRRDEEPEAVDDHLAGSRERHGEPIGRRPENVDDEAERRTRAARTPPARSVRGA